MLQLLLLLAIASCQKLMQMPPSKYGTILIPGMAALTSQTENSKTYKVYTKGRLSTPIFNENAKKSIEKYGHASFDEYDSLIENFKTRFAFFRTDALQNISIQLEFRGGSTLAGSTATITNNITVGMDGDFAASFLVTVDRAATTISYNILGVPDISTYVALTGQEGYAIVADIDDTIKETGVMWKPYVIKNSMLSKFKPCTTTPELFLNLTGLVVNGIPPSFHYLSGTPQQFLPALQPFVERWFPRGEFVLPPLAKGNGGLKGFLDYKNFKVRTATTILESFPSKKLILLGDSTQFDPEAYAEVYLKHPGNIECIWIRISEGYSIINEEVRNRARRFERAFEGAPRSKWATFRVGSDLPTNEQLLQGVCRID